jgi:YegS C-terminal NAD kinase beta sandwich-like domain
MTIERGAAWGELGPLPADGVIVRDDAAAATLFDNARRAGHEPPIVGLLGGDLCTTLGGRGDEARLRSADAARLVVDVVLVTLDGGEPLTAVAHVLLRNRLWLTGPLVAAMNAAWIGKWNVAPRAHPNDGVLDVVRADLSIGDRLKAQRRMALGTHVPHPGIHQERSAHAVIELARPARVYVDSVPAGRARRVELTVVADALRVVV